jgi:hypothetical protein
MSKINKEQVKQFVEENIQTFHQNRLNSLEKTKLKDLLRKKNPYMFKAKNMATAQELVVSFLDAKLSSSEEKIFGDFLEDLAIYVAKKTQNAEKSASAGIDFEYTKNNIHYIVGVKSGLNWGNSSQWKSLEADFKNAIRVLKQSSHTKQVQAVLGICYGNAKTTLKKGIILQVTGQNFWYMISGDDDFYTDIIEPIGHKAKELNDQFLQKKTELINRFTKEFIDNFCDKDGKIKWKELVEFNSKNLSPNDRKEFK